MSKPKMDLINDTEIQFLVCTWVFIGSFINIIFAWDYGEWEYIAFSVLIFTLISVFWLMPTWIKYNAECEQKENDRKSVYSDSDKALYDLQRQFMRCKGDNFYLAMMYVCVYPMAVIWAFLMYEDALSCDFAHSLGILVIMILGAIYSAYKRVKSGSWFPGYVEYMKKCEELHVKAVPLRVALSELVWALWLYDIVFLVASIYALNLYVGVGSFTLLALSFYAMFKYGCNGEKRYFKLYFKRVFPAKRRDLYNVSEDYPWL